MPKKPAVSTEISDDLSYEAAITQLEQLIARMESGQLSLEDTLKAYQEGAALLKHCQTVLQKVEQQVKVFQATP